MNLLKIFDRKPALPDAPAAAPATPHRGAGVVETRSPAPAPVPQVSSRYSALVLVDDEFLQRQLSELFSANDEDWSWECVASVACARQLLDQRDFSLIITQARIQNQPVVDLLNEIHARRPGMLRYFYGAAPAPEDLGRLQGMRPAVIATKNRREMVIAQLAPLNKRLIRCLDRHTPTTVCLKPPALMPCLLK